MPFQFSPTGEMPLQKPDLEICHFNFLVLPSTPFSSLNRIADQKIHYFRAYYSIYPYYPACQVSADNLWSREGERREVDAGVWPV
jgi:hypothetical protein